MTAPICPLCGHDVVLVWDIWRCSWCGAEPRGPLPVPDPVDPSGAFL